MKKRKQLSAGSYWLSVFFCLIFVYFCVPLIVFAQDEIPADVAAAPDKTFSDVEKKALDIEKNVKKRTQLSIDLMENRLRSAEILVQADSVERWRGMRR